MIFVNDATNPRFTACLYGMKPLDLFLTNVKEHDSGCQISKDSRQSYTSDEEPSSHNVPYMVHHMPDETCKKTNTLELNAENLKHVSKIMCDVSCDGYRTKESFRKKKTPDSISRCSNDTGCGSDNEHENESCLEILKFEVESKKHPFNKSSSKDSGVVTNMCSNSIQDSMSDISDDIIDEEIDYSTKTFQVKHPGQIIVSCITAH